MADWAREAGRILVLIPFEKAPEETQQAAEEMCKACVDCVTALSRCVRALPKDVGKALELANNVEMLEEDIDERYSVARRYLAELEHPGFTMSALILLNEFLDAIEMVADWCENTADTVKAVVVRIH